MTDSKKSIQVISNQEVINFLSFPQQVENNSKHEHISQSYLQENEKIKIDFDGFDIQPLITDALETMSDFLLKN